MPYTKEYQRKTLEFQDYFARTTNIEVSHIPAKNLSSSEKAIHLNRYKTTRNEINNRFKELSCSFDEIGKSPDWFSKVFDSNRTIALIKKITDQTDKVDQAWHRVLSEDETFEKDLSRELFKENEETKKICKELYEKALAQRDEGVLMSMTVGLTTTLIVLNIKSRL